jgi:hypothetical protein
MQHDPARGEINLAAPELLDPRLPVDYFLSRAQAATHLTSSGPCPYRQYAASTALPATVESE